VVLLTRVVLSYQLNFLIPISKVEENMKEAQKRDAAGRGRFWFRRDIMTHSSPPEAAACISRAGCKLSASSPSSSEPCHRPECPMATVNGATNTDVSREETSPSLDESCILMSIDEIINGRGEEFPGLVPLLKQYLSSVEMDVDTQCTLQQYLNFIAGRASGRLLTAASWVRNFVRSHADYKHDSVVSDAIQYALLSEMKAIAEGTSSAPTLLGDKLPQTKSAIK